MRDMRAGCKSDGRLRPSWPGGGSPATTEVRDQRVAWGARTGVAEGRCARERMSTLDAGFFFVEDENTPMHVGSVAVFDGPPPSYGDVVRLLVSRLGDVPRYRQRVRTVPLHLGRPVWTDDPHFEILYHVRHSAVPAPGGAEQLRNLAGRVFAQRLDMAKPLWEMYLVEGLQDNQWALISKVHHCMIDGVAGADLTATLLQASADAAITVPQPGRPPD